VAANRLAHSAVLARKEKNRCRSERESEDRARVGGNERRKSKDEQTLSAPVTRGKAEPGSDRWQQVEQEKTKLNDFRSCNTESNKGNSTHKLKRIFLLKLSNITTDLQMSPSFLPLLIIKMKTSS
jgi:hypothetical protein